MVGVRPCGPPGLRERKKARTREAIVEAALDLFESRGFDATTVEDIAAAADVSPRTFFRYFESKHDLVLFKNHEQGVGLAELVAARPAEEGPVEAVRQVLVGRVAEMAGSNDVEMRELILTMGTPELRAKALDHFHEHQDELVPVLADRLGLPADALPAHLLAGVIGSSMWAIADRWVAEGGRPERLAPMLDEAFELLAAGFDRCVTDGPTTGAGTTAESDTAVGAGAVPAAGPEPPAGAASGAGTTAEGEAARDVVPAEGGPASGTRRA